VLFTTIERQSSQTEDNIYLLKDCIKHVGVLKLESQFSDNLPITELNWWNIEIKTASFHVSSVFNT